MNGDPTSRQSDGLHAPRNVVLRYLARFDEGEVIRWAFRGMLVGTIGVLALDLYELVDRNGGLWPAEQEQAAVTRPDVPPDVETDMPSNSGRDPREFLTIDQEALKDAMRFTLVSGGVMTAEGTIEPGAAKRLADEIAARGEYVQTVALNSPGGSVEDAMSMARLLREKGIATEVADGALCASSCPLVLAGGKERRAGGKAAVGVHQFYAVGQEQTPPAQAMSDAQATTARITRLLDEMGVDPALWLHALDTPPRALYYLTTDEMAKYRLTTAPTPVAR